MVYDITNEESFGNVKRWLVEIDKYARENVNKLLVGNKVDLDEVAGARRVQAAAGKSFAENLNIPFLETSAKSGQYVDTAFLVMVRSPVQVGQLVGGKAAVSWQSPCIGAPGARSVGGGGGWEEVRWREGGGWGVCVLLPKQRAPPQPPSPVHTARCPRVRSPSPPLPPPPPPPASCNLRPTRSR